MEISSPTTEIQESAPARLTPAEIKTNFTSEKLVKMNMDEYLALWRKSDPHYVAHVSLFGYRDHVNSVFQSKGDGIFNTSFKDLLADGKAIRPLVIKENLDPPTLVKIEEYLRTRDILDAPSFEKAKERFDLLLDGTSESKTPQYPDMWTGIHLTAEDVVDSLWGSEDGNQPLVVFPSDFIASQLPFNFLSSIGEGHYRQDGFRGSTADKVWNDVTVWPEDGIPVEAGIVFLPKNTLVDPKTGSSYVLSSPEERELKKVTDGVKAEEYWERYFSEHKEQRPNKIVYYDGSPAEAVNNFLRINGITQPPAGDKFLGFEDNRIQSSQLETDLRANRYKKEIKTWGTFILREKFDSGI
jgi:hypothetical protein